MHGDDAAGGRVLEGAPVQGGPALGAHRAGGVARGVVGVPLDPAVVAPARQPVEACGVGQRARHHRGVHVDAREVDRRPAGRGVELLAGGRPALGPAQLVPAEAEHAGVGGPLARRPVHGVEGVRERVHAAVGRQVDRLQGEPGLEDVDVRVDEAGCDQRPVEVDHLVGARHEAVGGVVGAEPDDRAVVHQQRFGEGVGGGVHHAVPVQGRAHRGTR